MPPSKNRKDAASAEEDKDSDSLGPKLQKLARGVAITIVFGGTVGYEVTKLVGQQKTVVSEQIDTRYSELSKDVSDTKAGLQKLEKSFNEDQVRDEGRRELIEYRLRALEQSRAPARTNYK